MKIAQQLVRLIVILMIIVAGKSVWARNRSPTSSHVGNRQTRYVSLIEAACHDRMAATCVLQASRVRFAPGLVNGVTHREAVVRQCLADFNRRHPGLIVAEQSRVLVDPFKPDPNLASHKDAHLCRQGVTMARNEVQAFLESKDHEFQATRARQRSAVANNQSAPSSTVREYPEEIGSTVVAQHRVGSPPPPATATASVRDDGLGPNLELRHADNQRAVVYARAGGQFFTVRSSWLRGKYSVDWKTVYAYSGNQNKDFIGACFIDRTIELDKARMKVKPYDRVVLDGPTNSSFVTACERRGGEFRFALQSGQTFEIPAKSNIAGHTSHDARRPAESSVKEGSASQLSVQVPKISSGSPALALAPAVSASVPATSSKPATEALAVDVGQDVSVEDVFLSPRQDASPATALTQDSDNRGPPEMTWEEWFSGRPLWVIVSLLTILLIYLIYDMRKTRIGQDMIKHIKAWRARIELWLDERRAGSGPPTD